MKKIIQINCDNGNLLDVDGATLMERPTLAYMAAPQWQLQFVRIDEAGNMLPVDMTSAVAFHAAVDTDFDSSTEPMVRTLDSGIDHSESVSGIFVVNLDCSTTTFYNKVNGRQTIGAWFEFRGIDTNDKCIYDYKFQINALGSVDPQGGDPLPPVSGGVSINDVYALLRSAVQYEFSDDGIEWHTPQQTGDIYYHSRYPEGEWSEPIELVAGSDGADGYNVKFEYSVDGTDNWHTPATSADFYFRNSNDNGSTWTSGILFRGSDGANGIGFELLGEYNATTTYNPPSLGNYECVYYNGSTYAYINSSASSGHTPPATSDSYWMKIAAQGSVENITVLDITDFDSVMSGILSGYAQKSNTYSISQIDSLLNDKANVDDVYSKAESEMKFIDTDELSSALNNYVALSQWSDQNNRLQGEINYLSGVISGGGGGGDLSNYYTKSEVNSISAYLQTEIDNIPSGGASGTVTAINFNGEILQPESGVITMSALPIASVMPDPNIASQQYMLYLGSSITSGDSYVGRLRSYNLVTEVGVGVWTPYSDLTISNGSATGNSRVWTYYIGNPPVNARIAYDDGWKLQAYYEGEGEGAESWHNDGVLYNADVSGQPWGRYYLSGNNRLNPIPSGIYWDFKPQLTNVSKQIWGCNIVTKGHLYELDEKWDDICIFVTVPNFIGSPTYLFKKKAGVTEWYEFNTSTAQIDEEGWYVKPNYSSAWSWDLFMGDTYHLQETTQDYTKMPWDFSGHLWRDTTLDKDIYPIIKRVFIGKWIDDGSMLS